MVKAQGPFSGTYTIGGNSPDYATINAAVRAVSLGFLTGPVVFNIRPGIYTEKVSIPKFNGVSAVNTVTFTSESGKASDVIITRNNTTNSDTGSYTVQLKAASNIVLNKLTIVNTGKTYSTGIHILLTASNNIIRNCLIQVDTVSISANIYGIHAYNSLTGSGATGDVVNAQQTLIENNMINGGYMGIRLEGLAQSHDQENAILNNTIRNTYYYGIRTENNDLAGISGNQIFMRLNEGQYDLPNGIAVSNCDTGFVMNGNRVFNSSGGGISIVTCKPSQPIIISNNFISNGDYNFENNTSVSGVIINSCNNIHFIYNTVYYTPDAPYNGSSNAAFSYTSMVTNVNGQRLNTSVGNLAMNNIFYCLNGAPCYYSFERAGIRMDYNNLYTRGGNFGLNAPDFESYKVISKQDSHSISVDPHLVSAYQLRTNHPSINQAAFPTDEVTTDIDGDIRDLTKPDIGADEFQLIEHDIALMSMVPSSIVVGENKVVASLKNLGIRSLKDSIISLSFSADGGNSWSLPELDTIKNLDTLYATENYTFKNKLVISEKKSYQLCVRINPESLASDEIRNNEQVCVSACIGVSGNFSVGGFGADFQTLQSAIDSIVPCGIAGPVVLNINPGTYTETIIIPQFIGASAENNLSIQSKTGNANDVVFDYTPSGKSGPAIHLKGAAFVRIKNISIKNTQSNSAEHFGLQIGNGASHNIISGCKIIVDTLRTGSGSTLGDYIFPVVFAEKKSGTILSVTLAHGNILENNLIKGGWKGIIFNGNQSNYSIANVIRNNQILKSYSEGMEIEGQDGLQILNNRIYLRTHTSKNDYTYGVFVQNARSVIIQGNTIRNTLSYGIYLYDAIGQEAFARISNNMIMGGFGNSNPIAIRIYNSDNYHVYHNTVLMDGSSNGTVFLMEYSKNIRLQNNIFYHKNNGIVLNISNGFDTIINVLPVSDNNCLYTEGNTFAIADKKYKIKNSITGALSDSYKDTVFTSFQSFRDAYFYESNSVSVVPSLRSDSDLHVVNSQLLGLAKYLPEVSDDIDGELRSHTDPYIGADEFLAFNVEVSNLLPTVAKEGDNQVAVTLVSKGFSSLKDSLVRLSYSTDGGQVWNAAETFTIKNLTGLNTSETFIFNKPWKITQSRLYNLCVRIEPPGMASDPVRDRESLCADVCVGLSGGTFTVGGLNPDFPTITDAIQILEGGCGLGGPVIFNVRKGTYNESITFPLVNGSSQINSITLQSESGKAADVIIKSNGGGTPINNFTVLINGTDYVFLKNLTISNTHAKQAAVVRMSSGATHNTISNCIIKLDSLSSADSLYGVEVDRSTVNASLANSSNVISNNSISGGAYGIFFDTMNPSKYDDENSIQNNSVLNTRLDAIHLFNQYSPLVSGNRIVMNIQNEFGTGISLDNIRHSLIVRENNVRGASTAGINLVDVKTDSALITNNMLGGGFKDFGLGYGIYMEESQGLDFIYNSVHYDSQAAFSAAFYAESSKQFSMFNNIWSNKGGGYSMYVDDVDNTIQSDYNDLYTSGSTLANWDGADRFNLNDLRMASNQDQHSISVAPVFFSSTNLHTKNSQLDGKGIASSKINVDYDGEKRSQSTPDIGADEFTLGSDIGVYTWISPVDKQKAKTDSALSIEVYLKNFGEVSLTNFPVRFSINGVQQETKTFTSLINPGETHYFGFNNHSFSDTGTYLLCISTGLSNDVNTANDSLCILIKIFKKDSAAMLIDGSLKAFINPVANASLQINQPQSIHLKIKNEGNTSISNFPLRYWIDSELPQIETFPSSLGAGLEQDYIFFSEWIPADTGIHIICAALQVPDDHNASNDEQCIQVHVFKQKTGIPVEESSQRRVFPNPAKDYLFVEISNKDIIFAVRIFNTLGQKIKEEEFGGNGKNGLILFDISSLKKGFYELYLESKTSITHQLFLKD